MKPTVAVDRQRAHRAQMTRIIQHVRRLVGLS